MTHTEPARPLAFSADTTIANQSQNHSLTVPLVVNQTRQGTN
jgi:hypothetical protein